MVKNMLKGNEALQADFLAARACAKYGVTALRNVALSAVLDEAQGGKGAKARFSFVVCSCEGQPLFAMDFYEKLKGNKTKEKARIKRRACKKSGFPLFIVESSFLGSERARAVVLAWSIELWFTHGEASPRHEFWPARFYASIDEDLDKLKALAGYRSFRMTVLLGGGPALKAVAAIVINDSFGWLATGTVTATSPVGFEGDMLKVLAVKDVYSKYLTRMADNDYKPKKKIKRKLKKFRKQYRELSCGSFGWGK